LKLMDRRADRSYNSGSPDQVWEAGTMAKSRDKGKREVKKKKKEKAPKGAPPPFSSTTFTPRREPGMPGSAGAPPE
jgi:hypothetical protein